jgi:glutaredoxin
MAATSATRAQWPRSERLRRAGLTLVLLLAMGAHAATAPEGPVLEVFTRAGCPRCEAAARFLVVLQAEQPGLRIQYRHVDVDTEALAQLRRAATEAGVTTPGVPAFRVGGALVVGCADEATTGARLRALLAGGAGAVADGACVPDAEGACTSPLAVDEGVRTRLFGTVTVDQLGLPLFTLVLGLLDGFNPCAMWVLLLLLSLLVNLRDRRRMTLVASTFVAVSGVMYFAFMAAWLNVFLLIGVSRLVQTALGLIALVVGFLNVKDALAVERGPSLSIPVAAKPGIYARMRTVLTAERLGPALLGVAVLAVLANVVELLCTAGFPAIYTAILARQPLSTASHYAYLGLYNLAYVADDALMVALAVVTLSRRRLDASVGRWLKLVSGLVMLALGGALVAAPQLLAV